MRVGIIFGGRSGEHEVSIVSASSVIAAMDKNKYEIVPIGITKEGKWYVGENIFEKFKNEDFDGLTHVTLHTDPGMKGYVELDGGGKHEKLDVVFPVLHGPFGEDGTIQGLFEMGNIPYVGCGVLASSLAMDKLMTKAVLEAAGVPVVPYIAVNRRAFLNNPEMILGKVEDKVGFPCFVKPANLGSSVGISKAKNAEELRPAIEEAMKYDRRILIEESVNAREIEVAVLGNDEVKASCCGEIIVGGEFYDYKDKYVDGKSSTQTPADLPDDLAGEIRDLAIKTYKVLDCAGFARVDTFIDRDSGKMYLNEINTIPGFTSISMYPKMWEKSGIAYPDLIDRLIDLAFERYEEKQKNQISADLDSDWHKS
jgi:D-alanine-D-alanine ligase